VLASAGGSYPVSSIATLFTNIGQRWNNTHTPQCSARWLWNYIAAGYMPQDLRNSKSATDGGDRGFIAIHPRRRH
jgi:hypothetical protein